MILDLIISGFLFLVILFVPGLLWAEVLLPGRWMRERLALAPGLSPIVLIPAAFIIWGPLRAPIDLSGAFLVFLAGSLPPLIVLVGINRHRVKAFIIRMPSLSRWKSTMSIARGEVRREHLILMGVVAFAAVLNFQPHMDYMHPLHTDEWHYIIRNMGLRERQDFLTYAQGYPETGYLALLALFSSFTGISSFDLVLVLPALLFSYAIVLFYVLGRRVGPGHMTIYPMLLIPTSVRYLGPALMVPVALFLVTFPLVLLLIHDERPRSVVLVAFLLLFQVLVHPPSAIALIIVTVASTVVGFRKGKKRSTLILVVLVLLSLLIAYPLELWVNRLKWNRLTEQSYFFLSPPGLTSYLEIIGALMLFLALVGAVHIIKNKSANGITALISSAVLIFVLILFVHVFPNFNNVTALHDRILFCLTVVMTIPAGYGLCALRQMDTRLALSAVAVIMIVGANLHFQADYYHIVNETEYDDFVWIEENLNDTFAKAVLDPWKAIAFRAVTGKSVYHSVPQGPTPEHETRMQRVSDFFEDECRDTSFLIRNKISIVYTNGPCSNPDLVEVHDRVYVLSS